MHLTARRDMININTLYFSVNRFLLLLVGLWPYQRSTLVRFQATLFFSILTSFVVFQFTAFVTFKCTPDLIIKIFSSTLFFTSFIMKYFSFLVNNHNVKYLLDELQYIHSEIKDKNEIAIIQKYAYNAQCYTTIIAVFMGCNMFFIISMPVWSRILDVFLNGTHPAHTMNIVTEYFVDQEKYFYLPALHLNATFCIGATVTTAIGTMFLACLKHTCGMFKIACYRIEQAIAINVLENITLEKKIICKKIMWAVDIHRKAMKFSESLISNFESLFFTLTTSAVIALSLNIFRIFQIATFGNNTGELLLHFLYTSSILIHLFLTNYCGQEITDHNNHVFVTVYNVQWYTAPLHAQKLILFLLQRGSKIFNLHVGGMYVASLETFATLMSASISYFTVLYSMQQ